MSYSLINFNCSLSLARLTNSSGNVLEVLAPNSLIFSCFVHCMTHFKFSYQLAAAEGYLV